MKQRFSPSLLVASIFTVIFAIGVWFVIAPVISQITTARQQLDAITASTQKTSTAQDKAATTISDVTRQEVNDLLPADAQQYDLSVQIAALCKQLGVTVTTIGFGATGVGTTGSVAPSAAGASTLSVTLTAIGTYSQLQQLTQSLTSVDRFLQVTAITITGSQGSGGKAISTQAPLTAQISALAYYLP